MDRADRGDGTETVVSVLPAPVRMPRSMGGSRVVESLAGILTDAARVLRTAGSLMRELRRLREFLKSSSSRARAFPGVTAR